MKFTLSLIALSLSGALAAPAVSTSQRLEKRFQYGQDKVRGVNLGGWLVLEPWITPSLWEGFDPNSESSPVDEFHLMQAWGNDAQSKMEAHWSSWYTQNDFNNIAKAGLNLVRIPIGYWAFHKNDGDSYVQGQAAYLDQAIGWARSAGLKVWVDLHGAPGSQNGFDNSGTRGNVGWQQGDTIAQTLAVLKTISQKYGSQSYQDVVVGIELLNEPLGPALDMGKLTQFYKDGFGQQRDVSDNVIVIEDAFQNPSYWNGLLNGNNNVLVDHHHYQVFSEDQVKASPQQQVQIACGNGASEISGADKWVVVGEWSSAMTDCATWLNGFGRGARYDGSYQSSYVGSCSPKNDFSQWDDSMKTNTRKFIEAQLDAFETQQGWIYWTWKTEGAAEWDMQLQINNGIFPQPLTSRQYPGQCN